MPISPLEDVALLDGGALAPRSEGKTTRNQEIVSGVDLHFMVHFS